MKTARSIACAQAAILLCGFSFVQRVKSQSVQLPRPSAMRTVGLIGGTSWRNTVDYYGYINKAVNDAYGNNTNPPLIIWNLNNQRIAELESKHQWGEVAAILTDAGKRLQASGAQAILLCSNTSHKVYFQVAGKLGIPILHIGDATGTAIRGSGVSKVGLIGTKYTMEDSFLVDWLKQRYGIETLLPDSADAREKLNGITQELEMGIFKPESKKYVLDQIEELRRRGAQAVVLGCTEFPAIIKPADVSIPVFDTELLHSQMAVDFILGKPGLAQVHPTP